MLSGKLRKGTKHCAVAAAAASRSSYPRVSITSTKSRGYAQETPIQDSKPPIALFGLDGTYASALYTAAVKSSTVDSTSKALTALSEVFKKDKKLPLILNSPSLTLSDKSQIVQELRRYAGGNDKGDTIKNFLSTLAENNRLGILQGVCEKFTTLMGAVRGEVELIVTSASKLEPKMLQRLETAITKSEYSQGKKLKVIQKINPELLGGLVVEIGDRTIDLSVSSKLVKMNKLLTDSV